MSELCVGIRGVDSLKHELNRTRESLRDTDATIEKLTGRPAFARPFARRGAPPRLIGGDTGRGRGGSSNLFSLAGYDDAGPPPAKRTAGAFGRLGLPIASQRPFPGRRGRDEEEEDELPHKPSLQSSVIATPKDTKSRQEAIAEQQSGAGGGDVGTARNRRMFGLLLGTLVKFKEDERTKEQQAEKRKAVELKLEEKQREERDRLKRERFQLFSDRRRHQVKLRALEQKMELVEIHSAWESETHSLENFIRTTAKPHVFFLPKSHIPESQSKLDESKRVLQQLISERRKQLEEELEEIMKEDKEEGSEALEEYGDSANEADNSEMADPDTSEYQKKKPETKTANEESDLDESDTVGVDYEQSFAAESAHDVSTMSESMQVDVPGEVPQKTVEETDRDEEDTGDKTEPESEKPSQEVSSKKDSADSPARDDKASVKHSDEKRREKHRGDERRGQERKHRHSSRSRRRSERHGSREHKGRDKDRKHSRSDHHHARDDDSTDKHRDQRTKDGGHKKKKQRRKSDGHHRSDSESDKKSKHSADEDQRSS